MSEVQIIHEQKKEQVNSSQNQQNVHENKQNTSQQQVQFIKTQDINQPQIIQEQKHHHDHNHQHQHQAHGQHQHQAAEQHSGCSHGCQDHGQPKRQAPSQQELSQKQQKRKQLRQKYKKQALRMRQKYMPLVKFVQKHKLKIKTAKCRNTRVEYFRINEMQECLQQNKQKVNDDSTLKELANSWKKDVILFKRPDNLIKLKYPKQLQGTNSLENAKFAAFKFQLSQSKSWYIPLILFAIVAAVLFPVWPQILKYAIWLICLYTGLSIIGIIILRLVLYVVCANFGVSFWLFPNFFGDCTILESFIPVISVNKWQTGLFSAIGRLLAFLIIGYYAYHLYLDPSWVFENIQITRTSIDDLHDWGVAKIKGEKNFSQSALTNLNDIMNATQIQFQQTMNLDDQNVQVLENNQQQVQTQM